MDVSMQPSAAVIGGGVAAVLVCAGLGIGLGVGLTRDDNDSASSLPAPVHTLHESDRTWVTACSVTHRCKPALASLSSNAVKRNGSQMLLLPVQCMSGVLLLLLGPGTDTQHSNEICMAASAPSALSWDGCCARCACLRRGSCRSRAGLRWYWVPAWLSQAYHVHLPTASHACRPLCAGIRWHRRGGGHG